MALRITSEAPNIADRFMIAQDGYIPEDLEDRKLVQAKAANKIYETAKYINEHVEDSRELSVAITKLEEALLWTGKAVFKGE